MLGKLFKYEMKSTARVFLPMFLIILALSGINKLAILFLPDALPFNFLKGVLTFFYILFLVLSVFLCIAVSVYRYYKNLIGQEGYLMFTLPVTAGSNIIAKGLGALVWMAATVAVDLVSLLIFMPDYNWLSGLPAAFARAQAELQYTFGWNLYGVIAGIAAFLLIIFLACLLQIYCAISIGQLSNNHKFLTSVGVYIGFYAAGQILMTVVLTIIALSYSGTLEQLMALDHISTSMSQQMGGLVLAILGSQLLLNVVLGGVYFFLSRHMLGKKLNLS